jgi:hypothetical protein
LPWVWERPWSKAKKHFGSHRPTRSCCRSARRWKISWRMPSAIFTPSKWKDPATYWNQRWRQPVASGCGRCRGRAALQLLASTYVPEEHRIRDTVHVPGQRVLTFAHILKYREFPLAELLKDMLELGEQGMGCPVEMEFSVNLTDKDDTSLAVRLSSTPAHDRSGRIEAGGYFYGRRSKTHSVFPARRWEMPQSRIWPTFFL